MRNYWYWINFLMWNELVITFYKSSYDLERIERQNISYGRRRATARSCSLGRISEFDERLLLEENNKMLKEILSFVRKVDSAEYRDHQDFMEFLRNVAADIWVEYTEPEQRGRLFNLINKKK